MLYSVKCSTRGCDTDESWLRCRPNVANDGVTRSRFLRLRVFSAHSKFLVLAREVSRRMYVSTPSTLLNIGGIGGKRRQGYRPGAIEYDPAVGRIGRQQISTGWPLREFAKKRTN